MTDEETLELEGRMERKAAELDALITAAHNAKEIMLAWTHTYDSLEHKRQRLGISFGGARDAEVSKLLRRLPEWERFEHALYTQAAAHLAQNRDAAQQVYIEALCAATGHTLPAEDRALRGVKVRDLRLDTSTDSATVTTDKPFRGLAGDDILP